MRRRRPREEEVGLASVLNATTSTSLDPDSFLLRRQEVLENMERVREEKRKQRVELMGKMDVINEQAREERKKLATLLFQQNEVSSWDKYFQAFSASFNNEMVRIRDEIDPWRYGFLLIRISRTA